MRIGLIARRFDPAGGGTERDLIVTCRILADAGHEVRVFAAQIRGEVDGLRVMPAPSPGVGRTLKLLSFAAWAADSARGAGADLVLSFARVLDADLLRSGGGAHASYVAVARRWQTPAAAAAMALSPYHHAQMMMERRAFASARLRRTIAVSELVRKDLVASFAIDPATAVTLYNGVDLQRFRPELRERLRDTVRRELLLPEHARLVAFVGNGFARKGLRFLIEAWREVDAAAHFVVAGADRTLPRYRKLAGRLGVGDRIHFLGAQPQIERLFAAVDAFALPSLFEPFGNVVMEALAAGLPVLCSEACGAAELFDPVMRELVIKDPTDLGALSRGLNELLRVGQDMQGVARATAERFTWDAYGTKLLNLIAGL
jgi:UDP-glucose:(heptosyl)LPS alpha-1,3-glucosyltransferase